MQHLIISFTGMLGPIHRGELTEEQLSKALFYLGCTREHAFSPWNSDGHSRNELEWITKDEEEQRRIHNIVKHALLSAEADNRAIYRINGRRNSIDALNKLLVLNNHEPLIILWDIYNYPAIERAVEKQCLQLTVVWR